jgi:hypothetical protein
VAGVSDILLHFEWHTPEQAKADLTRRVLPWVGQQLEAGRALAGDVREYEAAITTEQRGYYHGVVLTEIALYARPNGQQFPLKVWKEHFREAFLGFEDVTAIDPITGRKTRRRMRVSTEDLGIRAYAEFIDKVIAFAADELAVVVSQPLPTHLRGTRARAKAIEHGKVDADTGEILEHA